MIIDRYERPVDWDAPEPSDPILQELNWILEDPELFALYERDVRGHYKGSRMGRPTISLEASYRLTFLRRRKKWTYRQAEETVRDSPGSDLPTGRTPRCGPGSFRTPRAAPPRRGRRP